MFVSLSLYTPGMCHNVIVSIHTSGDANMWQSWPFKANNLNLEKGSGSDDGHVHQKNKLSSSDGFTVLLGIN